MPYVEFGGAYNVEEIEDITNGLINGLTNKNLEKKLKKGRKRFIHEYLYKNDGKSTDRMINEIKRLKLISNNVK